MYKLTDQTHSNFVSCLLSVCIRGNNAIEGGCDRLIREQVLVEVYNKRTWGKYLCSSCCKGILVIQRCVVCRTGHDRKCNESKGEPGSFPSVKPVSAHIE